MDAKDFANQLVKTLRKRSAEYNKMAMKHGWPETKEEQNHERAVATALDETADCIEETLHHFGEE